MMNAKSIVIGLILLLSLEVRGQESLTLVAEHLGFLGRITGIYLNEETAFISTAEGGMYVYDIWDLDHPALISRQRNLIVGQITEWNGMLAAMVGGGVTFIDISNLENLRSVGGFGNGEASTSCAVGDDLGFLSYMEWDQPDIHQPPYIYSGFEIYNLSDFRRPARVYGEYYDSHGGGRDVGFRSMLYYQEFLFTEFWNGGLINVWDLSDPASPEHVNEFGVYGWARRIIDRDRLFAFDYDEIHAWSLENNPAFPDEILHIEGVHILGGDVEDTLLYTVGWEDSTLRVLDISNPEQPESIGELNVGLPLGGGIMIRADRGIATGNSNALLLDLSDPTSPSLASTIGRGEGSIRKSWKFDDLLLTLVDDQGLFISDCSNPEQSAVLSRVPLNNAWGLAKYGHYVYVPEVGTGVVVIDIENPRQPRLVGQFQPGIGNLFAAAVSRDALYVAAFNGVKVYDISNPAAPEFVRTLSNATTYKLEIVDSTLICQHREAASLYALRNPLSPQAIQPYQPNLRGGDRILGMAVVEGTLFLHRYWEQTWQGDILDAGYYLDVVDISRQDTARLLGSLTNSEDRFPWWASSLFNLGGCLGVIENDLLYKYDFATYPDAPFRILDRFQLERNSVGPVYVEGDFLYNSTPGAVRIYDARPLSALDDESIAPSDFSLAPPYPNPFNSSVTISFTTGIPHSIEGGRGGLSLRIYDLSGRLVVDLTPAAAAPSVAAEHKVVWDAKGVGSGVYIVRISVNNFTDNRKVVLIN